MCQRCFTVVSHQSTHNGPSPSAEHILQVFPCYHQLILQPLLSGKTQKIFLVLLGIFNRIKSVKVFTPTRRSASVSRHTKKRVMPPDKQTHTCVIMLLGSFTDENHSLNQSFMSLLHALSQILT